MGRDDRALDEETWEEALARALPTATPATGRSREWLNTAELSYLLGVSTSTILRWRAGQGATEIARAIGRARWRTLGEKLAFVKVDDLPLHLLLPAQLRELETILAVPMGAAIGGRRRTDREIEVA